MELKIACQGASEIALEFITEFQGDLKQLDESEYQKLKARMLKDGFSFPFFIWKHEKTFYCIDGHQRKRVLIRMRDEDSVKMPEKFPCVWIHASSIVEAKRKLLSATSQYGKMTGSGLYDFSKEAEIEFKDLKNDFRFDAFSFDSYEKHFIKKDSKSKNKNLPEDSKQFIVAVYFDTELEQQEYFEGLQLKGMECKLIE